MGRITRGWALAKQSWVVFRGNPSLAVFPLLSTLFAIVAIFAIWGPTALASDVLDAPTIGDQGLVFYIAVVVTAYVSTFIAVFFNVALSWCAARTLRGEESSIGDVMRAAFSSAR